MAGELAAWTAKGLRVTAVVYGPPAWARVATPPCSPAAAGFAWFCAPTDHANYGRFAGLLARRYDGQHGVRRIVDFAKEGKGQQLLGPLGWAWTSKPAQGKPIYRCAIGVGKDHFVSSHPACEGQKVEQLLGFGL